MDITCNDNRCLNPIELFKLTGTEFLQLKCGNIFSIIPIFRSKVITISNCRVPDSQKIQRSSSTYLILGKDFCKSTNVFHNYNI